MLSTPPCIKGDLFGIQEHLYRRKGKIVTSFLIAWSLPSRGDQFAVALTAQGFVDEPNPFKKMSLWTLLQAALLVVNAAAILNEQRFLDKYGLGFSQLASTPGEGPGALKHQIIGTLHAATYMRVPLVIINVIVIVLKLIIG